MIPKWHTGPRLVPITDADYGFPVRRIYCVGRNYVDHIREMREGDERDDPFFFQKPTDAIELDGAEIPYPPATHDLQYEGELVVAIGERFNASRTADPMTAVFGFAAGIDLTRRDLQKESVAQARPWESGKSFDHSAPCGAIVPREHVADISSSVLTLDVNGEQRQQTSFDLMIWSVSEIVSRLGELYTLEPGDLIYTGTPAGVSTISSGDQVRIEITELPPLTISIIDQEES